MKHFIPSNFRLACSALALVALIGLWSQWAARLQAQPTAAAPDAAVAEPAAAADVPAPASEIPAPKQPDSLGRIIFVNSSWFGLVFYIVLGLFSVVALAVVLERLVHLQRERVMPYDFIRRLRDMITRNEDNIENLRSLCEGSNSPIANILKAGIMRAGRPLPEVEKGMEDAAVREMAAMRSRNRPLAVVGSVAPLVGLLGTVVGMIFAFRTSSQEGLGKAELLAQGIYLALMTTAAGLTIAIPSLLFSAWFNATAERFMREIDETLLETMPSFTRVENSIISAPVPGEPAGTR